MKKETLRLLLFLHGNHEVLSKLVSEANDARINEGVQSAKKAKKG